MAPLFNVAVLLYPGADIIDFSGPVETYSTNPPPNEPRHFTTTTFAHHNPVKSSANALTYVPDATFADIEGRIRDFDILVVPGAPPETIEELLKTKEGEEINALIRKFAALEPRVGQGSRILQSVCTGALFFAAAGVLANRTVTTHHTCFEQLVQFADQAAGGEGKSGINAVRERWVDAGATESGVRIVTAGGVSSGIDASLWIVETLVGRERAEWVGEIMEFERRGKGWEDARGK
ncbi:ThiJ/PfpI family protein-like protein [Byssothecium circinans]|uniref:ThiJ/PfpI family protein-like protein n=1 Tax=Byssothecium circinans TaxID=147558 RepID=A0A6A5T7W5_9PLEO|nr:ThiJ/PfpI family protein-like protein [Byssothecium circinans]